MAAVQVASFHLVRDGRAGVARVPHDRWQARSVAGLIWSRSLGVGRDGRVHRTFDPRRRAMFAVWRDHAALDAFMASHPIARRWQEASESWHVSLRPIRGHGRWAGDDVLEGFEGFDGFDGFEDLSSSAASAMNDRPVVVLTRASVRPSAWRAFSRAAAHVDESLAGVEGLRRVVGVGEAPVLRLGTVSVWDSAPAAFTAADRASSWSAHTLAREAAGAERWFSESLFVTFAPLWSSGTWAGDEPLTSADQPA